MQVTAADIDHWITAPTEHEHLEFKEARASFSADKVCEYAVALANEGGGYLVLGVTDALPRRVVGTGAFPQLSAIVEKVYQTLQRRIHVQEIAHPGGRVLVFEMPAAPMGQPLQVGGRFLMRAGSSLANMTSEQLSKLMNEGTPDYSATPVAAATLADLDPAAIEEFRGWWARRSGNARLQALSVPQLLADAGLLREGLVTVASLVLFGSKAALDRLLPQAEIVFEYRSSDGSGPAQQRVNLREGFFLASQALWDLINLRNDKQSFQNGFFRYEIPTFDETPVREAILNAVAHRDYRSQGSVFVRQFPRRLVVESPGGFPQGITPENVLDKQFPRNRCIAEALEKCGLVERSGQGMNLIYESAIRHAKARPSFTGTDPYQVCITLHGEVADPAFVQFMEKIAAEKQVAIDTGDLLIMDHVRRDELVPDSLRPRVARLLELGVLERAGRKLLLSHRFYVHAGDTAAYTRRRGLDRETNKSLLLQHIEKNSAAGSPLADLCRVLPNIKEATVKALLQELKGAGRIHAEGVRRWAKWYPGPGSQAMNPEA